MARDGTALALDRGFGAMLEAGRNSVVPEVVRLSDREVHLSDGSLLRPDVVVAATGYRSVLEPLVGHLGVLDAAGVPTRVGEREGLYFLGFRPTLAGTFRDAEREAQGLAARVGGRARGRQLPADPGWHRGCRPP